ncbi:MAG TPA: acyl-CoA dehydrogenase family protein [Streptosporangiaceae bacterium]|nr:acyl-CoA dehydrogenase family protein [Streptosporangiaceae bacterium]
MSEATVTRVPAAGPGRPQPLDLLYGETENELRAAVRSVLEDKAAWPDVLARTETAETYDSALWHTLAADIGLAGLLIPEEHGGAGASYREAAVVAEEIGRAIAPVPFLGSAVVATTALLSPGDAGLLAELASGAVTAALAVPFAAGPASLPAATVRIEASRPGDEAGTYRLSGQVPGVADALPAGLLLVPADGVPYGLYAVRVSGGGVGTTPVVSLDQTRQLADLTFDGALARQVAAGTQAEAAVRAALLAGAGVLASEQFGLADRALELTVAYVRERRQFARPVGGFQAIKHRLADLWVAVSQARAVARAAADRLSQQNEAETELTVALAKAACSDTALKAAQEMVQLHGGIGFTWEHPAHLFLKRAKADSIGFGTADAHRASLARLANLPAPAAGA